MTARMLRRASQITTPYQTSQLNSSVSGHPGNLAAFCPTQTNLEMLKDILEPLLACLPCLKRESDLSHAHLAKWGPHLYLRAMLFSPGTGSSRGWRLHLKESTFPITTPIIAPQERHAGTGRALFCLQGSSCCCSPCHRRRRFASRT